MKDVHCREPIVSQNNNFINLANPAYLDSIGCDYLNYARAPNTTPDYYDQGSWCGTEGCLLPEENIKGFVNTVKYTFDSMDEPSKDEFRKRLSEALLLKADKKKEVKFEEKVETVEAYTDKDPDKDTIGGLITMIAIIIIGLIAVGFVIFGQSGR
jgi:hypothetical protein